MINKPHFLKNLIWELPKLENQKMCKVLFVCLGNICRSPLAEGIFKHLATTKGVDEKFQFDSAGLGDWHLGEPPDYRSIKTALANGIDLSKQRARQVNQADFHQFDLILAMDQQNLTDLQSMKPQNSKCNLALILQYAGLGNHAIPDPYEGNYEDFFQVFELINQAGDLIIDKLIKYH